MVRTILVTCLLLLLPLFSALALTSPGGFGGVGIDGVPLADGRILVRQLVAGGPAHLAGILNGDIITHIDSKPARGSDFDWIVNHRLRGRTGTRVLITIQRPGEKTPRHFNLIRRRLVVGPDRRQASPAVKGAPP
jgi:C-terminal processing protease CtpA/Prc